MQTFDTQKHITKLTQSVS